MPARHRILVDMDGILVDLLTPWLSLYNLKYGDDLAVSRLKTYETHRYVKPECGMGIYDFLAEPGLYRNLKPLPGALEGLKELCAKHDVFIVSAPAGNAPQTAADKLYWLQEHAPFIDPRKVFLGHQKELIKADVVIDDSPGNIKAFRRENPRCCVMTIGYPYNECIKNLADVYVPVSEGAEKAWYNFLAYLEQPPWVADRRLKQGRICQEIDTLEEEITRIMKREGSVDANSSLGKDIEDKYDQLRDLREAFAWLERL